MKNVPACASPPPASMLRVKVRCEPAPCSWRWDDAHAVGSLPACCEMIQMLNPTCPGCTGAGQSRGAVAGLGAPGALSACRPQRDLSSLIECQAPQLARAVCSPSHGVPKLCAVQLDGSAVAPGAAVLEVGAQLVPQGAAGVMGCDMGLALQLVHQSSEQGELKKPSLPCYG